MKIYSNGKDRVLTGNFPARFELLQDGISVPFLRTSKGSIRITGAIPEGELEIQELAPLQRKKKEESKNILDSMYLSIISESDFDRMVETQGEIQSAQGVLEKQTKVIEKATKEIIGRENTNAEELNQTNTRMAEMAKAFGKEIQADRDALNATSSGIKQVLSETAEVLDAKLQAHEVAKNPHKITKATVGLDAVDNTSDLDKPISKATKKALDKKADKADIEELGKKIEDAGKKQDSFQKSFENVNLYGGVGGDIIRGGKKGEFLSKASNKDGDYEWKKVEVSGYATIEQLNQEIYNRGQADNGLQSQIDAITVSSDVTDVVGTYAQLQAYDTSTLPPNSIIKVLQDESRDDETTYYRWVVTEGVGGWVLIGEEGPYYTKSQVNTLLSGYEQTTNKVTSISSSSTDSQYPSAKCMWDIVGDIESTINAIRGV